MHKNKLSFIPYFCSDPIFFVNTYDFSPKNFNIYINKYIITKPKINQVIPIVIQYEKCITSSEYISDWELCFQEVYIINEPKSKPTIVDIIIFFFTFTHSMFVHNIYFQL
jgi:hypothetical protein